MVKLDVRVDPAVRREIGRLLDLVGERGVWRPPTSGLPDRDDPALAEIWLEGLRDAANADFGKLRELVGDPRFGREAVPMAEADAEGVIRATSAVRLRLRSSALRRLGDEELEGGSVSLRALPPEERRLYAAYVFLGGLQELLVQLIDPALGGQD